MKSVVETRLVLKIMNIHEYYNALIRVFSAIEIQLETYRVFVVYTCKRECACTVLLLYDKNDGMDVKPKIHPTFIKV